MNTRFALALLLIAGLIAPRIADAQYFGRNKVKYENFDFKMMSTEHFDIYYYSEEEAAVQLAARMAERWYARLSKLLRHELSGRQPLVLYAAHPHFQQTNTLAGEIGEGTGGVTESLKRRVILPFAGGFAETDHVLGHELVHAFQYDMASRRDPEGNLVGPAVGGLPLWFIEGMAEYLSLGPTDANTAMWIRDAAVRERMPTIDQLDDPDFFPYRYGHAFWAYVAGRWGDGTVGDMLRATGQRADITGAMDAVLDIDEETFNRDWHEATTRTYAAILETTRPANTFAQPLITRRTSGGEINLAPSLSPDGTRVVFLSERSLFSIDMYVADVATGTVTRRLVETAGDPHFESLQFLSSAGDWAPDNRRFVFGALSKGQPVLAIVDVNNGRRQAEHEFPHLGEIFNPAWSPDGRHIAFSALTGGALDLYLFDLENRMLTQLTNDPFADLDPEWSPDGQELAWVTDRYSSNIEALAFGNYRIAAMDVRTRQVRPLAGFANGRNSNPEYSADGRSLFFIATPDGIPNVYRTELAGGATRRVTNVHSGVSGITPLTPALSVAAGAPGIVFSVYEADNYNLYATAAPQQLAGVETQYLPATPQRTTDLPAIAERATTDLDAAALPPANRPTSEVAQLLQAPTTGLPQPTQYEQKPYRASLSLDAIGQPTVGVGADRFGAYAAGGLSMLFSDMLGNHEVGATIQLTSRFEEIGGAVAYINRKSRWNWGVVGEQTPYVTGSFAQGLASVGGTPVIVQQTFRLTQIDRAVSGITQYPFSRVQRVEMAGGFRQISFDQDIETERFSAVTGEPIDRFTEELPRPESLNLAHGSAALVYDSSLNGVTGPILGQRYRFEFSQTAGSVSYSGVLADFRRYFLPVRPFTFAFRGLHYGRYGRDSEDVRLSPVYIGQPGLVRGYEITSFEASECGPVFLSTCAAFEPLIGSRLAIGNAEIRFPLMGLFNPRAMYGGVPVEIAFFTDAGMAWTSDDKPGFLGGSREWVRSVGAALRFNAFGYAIGELDYVKPIDRPERGWIWQFNLTPGF
jgi:Tol biopolymer transport system component